MRADQGESHIGIAIDEARAVLAVGADRQPDVLAAVEGVVLLASLLLYNGIRLPALSGGDGGGVGLDDACLLRGDLLDGIAEEGGVIEVDARDDRAQGIGDEVGRIQQTAHADLAYNDVTAVLLVYPEAQHGEKFEFGYHDPLGVELFEDRLEVCHRLGELLL